MSTLKTAYILVVTLALSGSAVRGFPADTLSLSGAGWFIHENAAGSAAESQLCEAEVSQAGWIPAQVPGNIQADLEAAHLLDPLWFGRGDARLASVARKEWWYRKDFAVPESYKNKRVELIFNGVDYGFDVWFNGQHLGHRAGQFRRFRFNVSDVIRPGETNKLAVRVDRMPDELTEFLSRSDGAMSGELQPPFSFRNGEQAPYFFINGVIQMRRLLKDLKSTTNFGWDWGVNIYTLGIWKDVKLEATGSTRIDWVQVQTPLASDHGSAEVKIHVETDSAKAVHALAKFQIDGPGAGAGTSVETDLSKGEGAIDAVVPLHKPSLWWPNGQGDQPMYELETTLLDAGTGSRLDSRITHFGVREIRWEQVEGVPANFINPYQLVVNGRAIRMMGSDLIPPDLLFGRIGKKTDRLLRLAREAGMNTIRIWGGGVILPEDFYDEADRFGIMISQEFPLANGWPETDPLFLANLKVTVTGIIKLLRNHPSVVEWVGGNEMPWQQGTHHPALHVLERVCAENDTRIFRATDPIQGSQHGPYDFNARTHYTHYNSVLATSTMRYGEFGAETPANLEVFEREIPPSSRWPIDNLDDPILIRKNVVQAVFASDYWIREPVIEGLFGPFDQLAPLIQAGQFLGAEGLRYAFDELRRKGKQIGGITSWDFNEPWPNGAGSYQVDYDGRPLMNYEFVKQALAPVSLTLRYDSILYDPARGVNAQLWLTSDAPRAVRDVQWSWIARDRRGRLIARDNGTASILPREARALGTVNFEPPSETALGPLFVELLLKDASGETLAERLHVFGADNSYIWPFDGLLRNQGSDEDDTPLLKLPQRVIHVLWIYDHDENLYRDLGWALNRFRIHSDFIPANETALREVARDARSLQQSYDLIWLGGADYLKWPSLAVRLGAQNLKVIAQAVRNGLGLAFEGGPGAFESTGFEVGTLSLVLPVNYHEIDGQHWQGSTSVRVEGTNNPITTGRLFERLPAVTAYNLVQAKEGAAAVLRTAGGDDLLVTQRYGQGHALAFASAVVGDWASKLQVWSGYPFLMARMCQWLAGLPDQQVPAIELPTPGSRLTRPVRRTQLKVSSEPVRTEGGQEYLTIRIENPGEMTALFCQPHPLLEYRADLSILNNHTFVPPGETRTITIAVKARSGDQLGQEGWRISCWNTDDVIIPPDDSVLLSVGRRDARSEEFEGFDKASALLGKKTAPSIREFHGNRPDSHQVPFLLLGDGRASVATKGSPTLRFVFTVARNQAARESRLRIHSADQDNKDGARIEITTNGHVWEKRLSPGLGIQISDPAHLAFPATAEFLLPPGTWKAGENTLEVRVRGSGWFSWDALDLETYSSLPERLPPR